LFHELEICGVLRVSDILSARGGATGLAKLIQNWDRESEDANNLKMEAVKDGFDDITTISRNCYPELNQKREIDLSVRYMFSSDMFK
jgi:hypothetical protein